MTKRWLLRLATVAFLVMATLAVLWLVLPGCCVTRDNYEKIEPGMTKVHVEAILGGPAGDYSNGRYFGDFVNNNGGWFAKGEWIGTEVAIGLWFNDRDEVVDKELGKAVPSSQGFWAWLRRLLPL